VLYGGSELSIDCWSLLLTVGTEESSHDKTELGQLTFCFCLESWEACRNWMKQVV
jgi:hypothetical protein